jgi:hypothetical protein
LHFVTACATPGHLAPGVTNVCIWASGRHTPQIFGENACHPERSERSGSTGAEILRFAQDDSPDPSPVRFREAFSPNIAYTAYYLKSCDILASSGR